MARIVCKFAAHRPAGLAPGEPADKFQLREEVLVAMSRRQHINVQELRISHRSLLQMAAIIGLALVPKVLGAASVAPALQSAPVVPLTGTLQEIPEKAG